MRDLERLPSEPLHPAEIELRHYARGSLAPGHAVALLAHCVFCARCGERLQTMVGDDSRVGNERSIEGRNAIETS